MVEYEDKECENIIENALNQFEFQDLQIKYEKKKQEKFAKWLCNIVKLQQYLPAFVNNEYNDITMVEYIDKDVIENELGMTKQIHIKLLLKRIEEFKRMREEFNVLLHTNKTLQPCQHNLIKNGILTINDLKKDIETAKDVRLILKIYNALEIKQILSTIHSQNTAIKGIRYKVSQLWEYRQLLLDETDWNDLFGDDDNSDQLNKIILYKSNTRLQTNHILSELSQLARSPRAKKAEMNNHFVNIQGAMHKYSNPALAISSFDELPECIRNGCKNGGIHKFNVLQKKVMRDLCAGNDSIIISPAASGKTAAIIMSSFYRLYIAKPPSHIMFICVDHIHAALLQRFCVSILADTVHLNVVQQVRGSRYTEKHSKQLLQDRNIFICTPGKAINLCEKGRNALTANLLSVTIFDGDTLLVSPLFNKLTSTFKWIPTNINVNFVSCSMCDEMESNIRQLVDYQSATTKKYFESNDYNNLKFWFINSERHLRVTMLSELCKINPYKQGVIFCANAYQAKIVQASLGNSDCFESQILESTNISDTNTIIDLYNNASIHYIIAHEYSPIHMLHKLHPHLLKIIIIFELRYSSSYLKRANIGRYVSSKKKIHVISLIGEEQHELFEEVEYQCKVQLVELPSNIGHVLCDDVDDRWMIKVIKTDH